MDSILTSIKKLLGIPEADENFDVDVIIHTNTALSVLTQLGVGPSEGFSISDKTAKWADFIPEGSKKFEQIKTYVYMKVKLIFDPPQSSAVIDAMKSEIAEFEWRSYVAAEPVVVTTPVISEEVW